MIGQNVTLIEGSEKRIETPVGWAVLIRAQSVGMPALLVVECIRSKNTAPQEMIRLRRNYWRYGPLGRVMKVEPLAVDGRLFHRTVFEIDSPRRSTVLAASSVLEEGLRLIVRLVVAGFGRVEPHLNDLYDELIRKALEFVDVS